ncbi:HlyD family secretion protein [Maridesulfovibrio ferrireducens]|uniref:HlyD family secretion protein n=1 Tax=Maridesulfovibrio ferrireducens TaxID=246191 RepID=A0A1G9JIP5_9BACT|nr:efflux RND transporter periplasmic adaptor subunit [Maridesulfovibrio ferrireducens]SDL36953.1 HlyD family secretion protein [Maridesulfovibrio ferrireducens]
MPSTRKMIVMKTLKSGVNLLKLLLMVGGFLFLVQYAQNNWVESSLRDHSEALSYRLEKIKRCDMENTISCTGTIAAVGTVEVGTQVSGTIKKVLVDYNDQVKEGQILAELDLDLFKAAVDIARASVLSSKAIYKQAAADYERNKPLYKEGHLSTHELLVYETERDIAKAQILSAKAAVKSAETNLENAQIKSPIDGVILERNIDVGQTVAASYSTPTLFIIAEDLSDMEIEANVDESDVGIVKKGQQVKFSVQSYPDAIFFGTVSQIQLNPTETSDVVTYTVIVDAPNKEGKLLPGMTATADFCVEKAKNELVVPNAALYFTLGVHDKAETPGIYILEKGIPKRVSVSLGMTTNTGTVIKDTELTAGESVIIGKNINKTKSSKGFLTKILPSRPKRGPKM